MEFRIPGAGAVCGRLGWISPAGWPLFANPDWDYGVLLAPAVLARQLRGQEAAARDAASLFDAAAAKALRRMAGGASARIA